jgi:hypothetical protein
MRTVRILLTDSGLEEDLQSGTSVVLFYYVFYIFLFHFFPSDASVGVAGSGDGAGLDGGMRRGIKSVGEMNILLSQTRGIDSMRAAFAAIGGASRTAFIKGGPVSGRPLVSHEKNNSHSPPH